MSTAKPTAFAVSVWPRAARLLFVLSCLVSVCGPSRASAEGLPRRAPPPSAQITPQITPEPYYQPAFNWGGAYAGAFVGGAHALWTIDFFRNNNHGHAELGADGFAGGGWVGYNWHMSPNVVVGIEADIGATNASQSNETFDNDATLSEYGMFGSVRGRAGYAFDRMLVFASAGFAFADITNNIQKGRNAGEEVVSENKTHTGYVLGAGVEYAFTNSWVGRVEYLYANYGMETLYNRDGNRADFENEMHLIRAGFSYRF